MDSLEIILERATKQYDDIEKQEMADKKNEYYKEYLKSLSYKDVSKEVIELLEYLKRSNIKMAIGSSSKNTMLILKQIDLLKYFDAVVDGNQITYSKPNPEVFVKAAMKLNLDPTECFVIEDARHGIDAANAGGFISIGIGDAKKYDKSTYHIENVKEIIKILEDINN